MRYSTKYENIIGRFMMEDKPQSRFRPEKSNFKELVKYALKKSFKDFNFRTLEETETGKTAYKQWENERKSEIAKKEQKCLNGPTKTEYLIERLEDNDFINCFVGYFQKPALSENDFDNWHRKTCQLFLHILNGQCNGVGNGIRIYKDLRYGKAQKIVNMMFKYLYCLETQEYQDHFKYCHMTLDNFTLEWFKRRVNPKRIDSWSNLVYNEGSVDRENYKFYQDEIRKHFKEKTEYSGLTPFQLEFYIWPEIQLHMAAEAFIFELNPETYKGNSKKAQDAKKKIFKASISGLIPIITAAIDNYKETNNLLKDKD